MNLKDLEEKAVEIEVNEDLQKIVQIVGSVESVSGFNERGFLHINSDFKISPIGKIRLKFKGTSPVRGGDRIKAGLILSQYFEEEGEGDLLYLGILKQDGSFGRIDYADDYNVLPWAIKELGLL